MICYEDNSYVVLDQPSKKVLTYQQGLSTAFTDLKLLPLLNSDCFFMGTSTHLLTFSKSPLTSQWEFMYLETSNGCFDIDPSLQAVAIANEKVLKLFEMRKFR